MLHCRLFCHPAATTKVMSESVWTPTVNMTTKDSCLLPKLVFCLLIIGNFAQAEARVRTASSEKEEDLDLDLHLEETGSEKTNLEETNLDDTDLDLDLELVETKDTDLKTGEKGEGAKASKDDKGAAETKSKGVTVKKKGNLKSKEKEVSEGEYKEEEIDADLWDKLVTEQKTGRNESKETEEDPKLEELEADVSRLTETDWSEAINFLKMEQFSSRQGKYFHFLKLQAS